MNFREWHVTLEVESELKGFWQIINEDTQEMPQPWSTALPWPQVSSSGYGTQAEIQTHKSVNE